MAEYATEAIVLYRSDPPLSGRAQNILVHLYTESLGYIEARVVSGKKIMSKLSPHLDVGNLIFVRLVYQNTFTVTDALTEERFFLGKAKAFERFSRVAYLLTSLSPISFPDGDIWNALRQGLRVGEFEYRMFLSLLGYGSEHAECSLCENSHVHSFFLLNQSFACRLCVSRFPQEDTFALLF